ncbi:MAG: hypothetical protein LH467_06700, partial [Gemmatimonadaceae bacterium]|nr:hypothetical protein [Gemmatimonadaceae bacterium]
MLARPTAPDDRPIINETRARHLAAAYVRTFGRFHVGAWEGHRKGPINLAELAPAPRVYFARSPYHAVPLGFHPSVAKTYGPWYLVPLLQNGTVVVLLAVSAYNTD